MTHATHAMHANSMAVHWSSARGDWSTPHSLFDPLMQRYAFQVDAACTTRDCLCPKGLTIDTGIDALAVDWLDYGQRFWLNPPYGRQIGKFVRKAYDEAARGALVVCLLPARTDTAWWHDYVMHGQVTFIRGRVKFGDATAGAPFPSALVLFA